MALTDIGRLQVLQAVAEFDAIGQNTFLKRYGFGRARDYFLVVDGKRYDSKAVLGAAHGFLPGLQPLRRDAFSGGKEHTVKLLRALGFEVSDASQVSGAAIGTAPAHEEFLRRVQGLRAARAAKGPRLYQPIALLWAIGRARRGETRSLAWAETDEAIGALLKRHGARGERPRPDYPVLALHGAGLWTLEGHVGEVPAAHGDSELRSWFAEQRPSGGLAEPFHDIVRRSGHARISVIEAVLAKYFEGLDPVPLLEDTGLYDEGVADDAQLREPVVDTAVTAAAQYEKWCRLLDGRGEAGGVRRRASLRNGPVRSGVARRAVLARSRGVCENPACDGQPADVTDAGAPILEVDHIMEIAKGGPDHPSVMAALCPNCHAVKTRGRSREALRATLLEVALAAHLRLKRSADG
ncbi:HNH endonuclease [Streptomyces sp. OZ13]|uniref:HNH endonuclease n=1 Tax=Streptomyces sp. OZ13 TaxID=3452210 RepID=UPI003F8A4D2F